MFVRSILLGAAAVSASAMLVLPDVESLESPESIPVETISVEPIGGDNAFPEIPMLFEENTQSVVELPCTQCPFREVDEEGAVSWKNNKPSSLVLDFSVDEGQLLANGRPIFPPTSPTPIRAIQQLEDGTESDAMPVGYALEVMPVPVADEVPGTEMLDIRFTVLDLEANPVPVDTVAITIAQDPAGELYILNTEIEKTASPADNLSWKKCAGKPKCLQDLLIARISGLLSGAKERVMNMAKPTVRKGCKHKGHHNSMGGHHAPHKHQDEFDLDGFFPLSGLDAPKGHSPHHHGHHPPPPPPRGAFAHTFSRVFRFVVVPAILGVLAGLTASAVGMIVGQAVIFLWRRYRGTTPEVHKAAWEDGNLCEKQGLMTESEGAVPEDIEETSQRGSMDKN